MKNLLFYSLLFFLASCYKDVKTDVENFSTNIEPLAFDLKVNNLAVEAGTHCLRVESGKYYFISIGFKIDGAHFILQYYMPFDLKEGKNNNITESVYRGTNVAVWGNAYYNAFDEDVTSYVVNDMKENSIYLDKITKKKIKFSGKINLIKENEFPGPDSLSLSIGPISSPLYRTGK